MKQYDSLLFQIILLQSLFMSYCFYMLLYVFVCFCCSYFCCCCLCFLFCFIICHVSAFLIVEVKYVTLRVILICQDGILCQSTCKKIEEACLVSKHKIYEYLMNEPGFKQFADITQQIILMDIDLIRMYCVCVFRNLHKLRSLYTTCHYTANKFPAI